jgi:hypothetical protein
MLISCLIGTLIVLGLLAAADAADHHGRGE